MKVLQGRYTTGWITILNEQSCEVPRGYPCAQYCLISSEMIWKMGYPKLSGFAITMENSSTLNLIT